MAQLLIRLKDNLKAINSSKKIGDVVVAVPDNHVWSPLEKAPYFLIVNVNESVSECNKYLEYHTIDKPENKKEKKIRLDIDTLLTRLELTMEDIINSKDHIEIETMTTDWINISE